MLGALRRLAANAEILAHGKGAPLGILAGEGLYDRAEPVRRRGGPFWPWLEGRRLHRACGPFDLALLLPNSLSSALCAWASGATERVGYALNGRAALLTRPLRVRREGLLRPVPMVDYYLGLLEALGAEVANVPRLPRLRVSAEAAAWAEAFFLRHGLAGNRPVWALNVGGSWETKRWLPRYAGQLVRRLRREGLQPLLLRGPDEQELAAAVCEAAGEPVPGADEVVGLTELVAVLARCALLVTTDSGPRHFGVAAGIPVLVLIGPTHPGYTAVDHPWLRLLCERTDCWPCHLKVCPLDFRCMRALTPERVLAAGNSLCRAAARPVGSAAP
ncbi:MAG: glycosyltransferase family 9 protein [Planctomycetota bacterium]|nr:MAG: glycosyltransferase family 9 protein [Planctomycetota bacterium]